MPDTGAMHFIYIDWLASFFFHLIVVAFYCNTFRRYISKTLRFEHTLQLLRLNTKQIWKSCIPLPDNCSFSGCNSQLSLELFSLFSSSGQEKWNKTNITISVFLRWGIISIICFAYLWSRISNEFSFENPFGIRLPFLNRKQKSYLD